ncbi:retrovirus-related Pol polyprotein from transposon TNT 1-94 [Gossypium australe]|uniref:Retrovirus-related Pol polyprotein from transposon TNT 1-94 n=1 Tax=Gossypium australe TaxID=47621 RepID=A0A5B6WZF5_9ROSI|nr:retrovirus-related Pol polyprotein from transposon TNT 1-94 [Gossypium australe]
MIAIEHNNTWELSDLPKRYKIIVYKTKLKENGKVDKFKARLEFGVDYKEVFAPVARHDTIKLVIALAAQNSWPIFQLDVKSAFLHVNLKEEVFVEQPPEYVKHGNEHKVYRLNKALYGLKQAPRAWYSCIEAYFLKEGFLKCSYEHTLFTKVGDGGKMIIVCLYVDDLIFIGSDVAMFNKFKKSMMIEFDMTDLGMLHYFLGIKVVQSTARIFISQKKYVQEILDRFQMKNCNSVCTPIEVGMKLIRDPEGRKVDSTIYKQMVGSLMYLTATRPNIMHAISLISRFMKCPKEIHLLAAKRMLRYLKGIASYGLFYIKGEKLDLFSFTHSDYTEYFRLCIYAGLKGYYMVFKKQPIVTLSTIEAEFVSATACAYQAILLRKILDKLHLLQQGATTIFCDNNSTIKLSKNLSTWTKQAYKCEVPLFEGSYK